MSAKLPSRATVGTTLAVVGALFIGYIGVSYLLAPQSMALIPIGDMFIVLFSGGAPATALAVTVAGGLLLSGSRPQPSARLA
ncbi:hypothetical protein [Streptosporangium roseum]|uniref:hypothetical protein n=1 Tax=Streptosporangium roseum TaxID=2001 RepID=UPI003327F194